MCVPVQPPWLPGYTDVAQTVLVILAMMGLFPDRPRVCVCVCVCTRASVSIPVTGPWFQTW